MTVPTLSHAPCGRTRNRAFIDPDNVPRRSIAAAIRMCEQCPMRKECARLALQAGSMLTEEKLPADGVIMAGVVTRGEITVRQLEMIAGIAAPVYEGRAQKRGNVTGKPCLNCGRTLHSWTRVPEDMPPGMVMHYSRQFCVNCRTALSAYLRSLPEDERRVRRGLMKPIDRKRHHHNREKALKRKEVFERRRREIAAEQGVSVEQIMRAKHAAGILGISREAMRDRAIRAGVYWTIKPEGMQARAYVNFQVVGCDEP